MYVYVVISIGAIAAMFVIAQEKWSVFTRYVHPWLVKHAKLLGAYRSIIAIIGFPVVIFGGILAYVQIVERLGQPDVGLHFERATNTVVSVINLSNVVVHKPIYQVVLFNLDEPREKRLNPLPVPVRLGDYIRVGERWGPNAMISIRGVSDRVQVGNRLVGWATASCPDGPRRFYWVYIKQGEGGWYAETEPEEFPNMTEILNFVKSPSTTEEAFFRHVNESQRIPIN